METPGARLRSDRRLPPDVHVALVDSLFGTVGSFAAGVAGGLILACLALFKGGSPAFTFCAISMVALVLFRLVVLALHGKASPASRALHARRWEVAYAVGGIGFMADVGITAALLLDGRHDDMMALYGLICVLGCAGSVAGRNAGRPLIVMGQAVGLCLPAVFVLSTRADPWFYGLSAILLLVLLSIASTTRFINESLVTALLAERESRQQRIKLAAALDSMTHGLCMASPEGAITVLNRRLRDAFAIPENPQPATLEALAAAVVAGSGMDAAASAAFVQTFRDHVEGREPRHWSEAIGTRIFLFRSQPMEPGGSVVVVEDVTEARRAAQKVEYLAQFDALTGLINRFQFHQELYAALDGVPGRREAALFAIDLDRFKDVNDTLGHPAGDALLRQVADRLRAAVDGGATVARFGGDEFQILFRSGPVGAELDSFARRLIARLSEPYDVDGNEVSIGASVGIATSPMDACDADDLLRCADMALYGAKALSRGTAMRFVPAMHAEIQRRREVEQDLRTALQVGHVEVFYQPIVDARTGRVAACEALVRWRDPVRGLVAPDAFIPIAEECGLIADLGEFVLRRACEDAARWPADVRVAVNVSPRQFLLRRDLVERVEATLASTGLAPGRLEVEITESVLLEAKGAVEALARAGVRISLDDFGTGYSGLSYLRLFPIHKVKIDRSFVRIGDHVSLAIIEAVSGLAAALGMDVVAEGVETPEQIQTMADRQIHLIQGYVFSRPKPLAEIMPLLERPFEIGPKSLRAAA